MLTLIMPVLAGRGFLSKALTSVLQVEDNFYQIIVSINGVNFEKEKILLDTFSDNKRFKIIFSRSNYTPNQHFRWIMKQKLVKDIPDHDFIFFLADDDIILEKQFRTFTDKFILKSSNVVIGPWFTSIASHSSELDKIHRPGFLNQTNPRNFTLNSSNIYTNMSGMIVSKRIVHAYSKVSKITFGSRFEYFLCTHKDVKVIQTADVPYIRVTIHPEQSGGKLSPKKYAWDEVIFQFWLIFHKNNKDLGEIKQALLIFLYRVVFNVNKFD